MHRVQWALLALLLALVPAVQAQEEDFDVQRLRDLVESGRMEQAYKLAAEHVGERAGDLRFDLYYGIAAIDTGRVSEGIFALERVLMRRPGLDRARLEYARGLFLQEDDLRARRQFETVLAHDPPPAVVDRIERYLAAIERRADRYRTTITGHIGTEVGYDDNVNRAPDAESIDLGFATLQLDDDSQDQGDAFLGLNGRVQVSRPLVPGLNVVGSLRGDLLRHDDESDFDTSLGGGRVGLRWTTGPHRLAGFFTGNRFYVGGDPYQGSGGISVDYRYRLGERSAVHGLASYTRLRYDDLEVLDSSLAWVGGGLSWSWSGSWSPSARATVLLGEEDAEGDSQRARASAQRDLAELRGQVAVAPAAQWTLRSTLRLRTSDYDAQDPLFAEAREEDYYGLRIALDWRPSAQWRVGPYIDHSQNDANIDLYEYERSVLGIDARYTFF